MPYTWTEFKSKVIEMLTEDGSRVGQTTFRDNLIRQAVIDIQSVIPFFRVGHTTTFGADDVTVEQQASFGTLPSESQITRAWFTTVGYGCSRMPMSSYDWGNRHDLISGAMARGQYAVAISKTGDFYCWPRITKDYAVVVEWDGMKLEFADGDTVPFTEEMARVVSYFVKAHFALTVNNDLTTARAYMDADSKSGLYFTSRTTLYRNTAKRTRILDQSSTPQGQGLSSMVLPDQDEAEIEFCVVGDSGESPMADSNAVAALVRSFEPDFLIHTGDNNLPSGDPINLWERVQAPYGYLLPNLWQAFGGNDVVTDAGAALLALLPHVAAANAGKKYYSFKRGPVSFFVLNSGATGVTNQIATDAQATWLQAAVAASGTPWNVVIVHKAPYTSDSTLSGGLADSRLSYSAMGVDLVLSGWGRNYERIKVGSTPYVVNGLGGATKRGFSVSPVAGSQVRYNSKNGVLRITASATRMQVTFHDINRTVVDRFALTQ